MTKHDIIHKALSFNPDMSVEWRMYGEQLTVQIWDMERASPYPQLSLSFDELAHVHPALPVSLKALLDWKRQMHDIHWCYGDDVLGTVALLREETVLVQDVGGREHLLCGIKNVRELTSGTATVYGLTIKVKTVEVDGREVSFVAASDQTDIKVDAAYLTVHFPGWQARLQIADSLALTPAERATYLLPNTPLSRVETSVDALNSIDLEEP